MFSISTAGVACKEDRFFVALRKSGTSIGERWEFPGGKAEEGESPEEALEREFLEEFNVKIEVGDLLTTGKFFNKGLEYHLLAYYIDLKGKPEPVEHQATRWATMEELNLLDFPDSDLIIVETLISSSAAD